MAQDFVARLLMTVDAADLTEDQVRSFKDNPNLVEFIEDREAFGLHILKRILLVAVAFVAGSKIIAVKFDNDSTNSLSMSRVILCLKWVPR